MSGDLRAKVEALRYSNPLIEPTSIAMWKRNEETVDYLLSLIPEGAVLVTEETLAAALHKQFPSRWNETAEHKIAAAILRYLREGT